MSEEMPTWRMALWPTRGGALRRCTSCLHCRQHRCKAMDKRCAKQSNQIAGLNPTSQKIQIELARPFLGIAGRPQHYLLVLVPPAPGS